MGHLSKEPTARIEAVGRNGSKRRGATPSREELRAAELGFAQLLRRKRFPAGFLARHSADLLAQARLEYTRHVARGENIENPPGWIIHCAWRRTQNLLEKERRAPHTVPIEDEEAFVKIAPTPEEEVLEADRHRKLREAVEQLPPEERKVIALAYFEGMSVREASRTLKWDSCKGDRRHRSAVKRLYELLGVKDASALQIEIGAAAWTSLLAKERKGLHLPSTLHAALDAAGQGVIELIARGGELGRRVATGGAINGGVGGAAGAGARTAEVGGGGLLGATAAGVCGAAAVACLATGVVGPGLGGAGVAGHAQPEKPAAVREAQAPSEQPPAPAIDAATAPHPTPKANQRKRATRAQKRRGQERQRSAARTDSAPEAPSTTSSRQLEAEYDPLAGGGESSAESSPTSSAPTPSSSTGGRESPSSPPAKRVEAEYGF